MIWIYKDLNDKVISSRNFDDVKGDYIELERMIPQPNKLGYISILCADFESKKVWFELKPTFQQMKKEKAEEVLKYDSSDAINEFKIENRSIWLDKNTRAGLKLRFESEKAMGQTETTLWYNGESFKLQLEQAIQMLYAIEIYASSCYDITQQHLTNINKLNTIEDIETYDYRSGYPEKLTF